MNERDGASAPNSSGRSPILITASLSVCVLALVVVWSIFGRNIVGTSPSVMTAAMESVTVNTGADESIADIAARTQMTAADIGMIGPAVAGQLIAQYQTLKEEGLYTPEIASAVAQELGANVSAPVPFTPYTAADLTVGTDSSYEGMLAYRGNLKTALDPIASLEKLEISIFAAYVETKNPAHLEELRAVVSDYAEAQAMVVAVVVPPDAAVLHLDILNAMGQFAAALEALAANADDPFTSTILLRTYNDAESDMIVSFNNLAKYFAHHPQP